MIATIKHFPGHGDPAADSPLGLPVVTYDRARLNQIELLPFRRGIEQGADAVMAAHIEMPALDPAPSMPATFSPLILRDLLRTEMRFDGLLYTDSMSMDAVSKMVSPDEGAVRAVLAGADQVLHSPDPVAAFNGLKAGGRQRAHCRGAPRRGGRSNSSRESVGWTARAAHDRSRRGADENRWSRESGCRTGSLGPIDDACQRRSAAGAAVDSAGDTGAVPLGAGLSCRLADCRTKPDVHPGAAEAVAAGDREIGRAHV